MQENYMSKYVLVRKTVSGPQELVTPDKVIDKVSTDLKSDWYQSLYYYNDEHLKLLKTQGHLRGVKNVKTDKLLFDFDDKENPNNAKRDAKELIVRLKKQNIREKDIEVYFSSNKGIHVSITLTKQLNPPQIERAAKRLGKDLPTFDSSVYDHSQILRIPWSYNPKSKLHKIPLTIKQLDLPIEDIKKMAENINNIDDSVFNYEPVEISPELIQEELKEPLKPKTEPFNMSEKPRHWTDYRWALLNSVGLKTGERHEALMRIAATCRGLGYTKDITRALCLSFDEKYQALTKSKPVEDLEHNILHSVFSSTWNGGMYSYKNDPWIQEYSKRINITVSQSDEELTIEIDEAFDMFKDYAQNIDSLTVKSGIPSLDEKLRMTIGMSVGIVASAGVGKTTVALQILNSMSNADEQSVFFSYDMYHALVFQKLVQKHLRVTDTEIFQKFKDDDQKFQQSVIGTLKKEYKNVEFCFKTGQTPEDIERTIKHTEQKTNKKVRLVVVDYNELVMSDYSDATQSSAFVAQKLREIATKLNVCVIMLLQPNKMSGSPADELKSYRAAKGSSAIEQSVSVMLGMSRPGYNPRRPEDDQFITIKCLKNRMGGLFTLDLGWSGATGDIYELTDEQMAILSMVRERKKQEEAENGNNGDWT